MFKRLVEAVFLLALILSLAACGGAGGSQNGSTNNPPPQNASTFVTADDFPLPAVLSFNVTVTSIVLTGNNSSTSNLLAQPQTVDFARLVGLRNLLAFSSVPAGSYSGVTFQLQNPVITAINLGTSPASTTTLNGTWASGVSVQNGVATVTVPLKNNLTIDSSTLMGLHMHFDLRSSLQTDSAGQVTGVVNPQITANAASTTDDDAMVTDLRGAIVSINTDNNTFVLQTWDKQQITVAVNSQTLYNSSNTFATFKQGMVVEVQGSMQGSNTLLAQSIDVISIAATVVEGSIISVDSSNKSITIVPSAASAAVPGVTINSPVTLDISTVQSYSICGIDNWLTNFVFDASSLIVGQRIVVTGTIDTGTNPSSFVPQHIRLTRQGVAGTVVLNSVNQTDGNAGTFQLQNSNLIGSVLGTPLTVQTTNATKFIGVNGLSGIAAGGSMQLEVRGLLLNSPTTNSTTLYAGWVKVVQ